MTATMIKIERNAQMAAAIERCKRAHPRVRRIDTNTVTVSTTNGEFTVRIAQPREDLVLAECSCQAGRRAQLCYHVPAAFGAPAAPAHKLAGVLVKANGKGAAKLDGWDV
jgi:hypothetical protein